MIDTSGTFRAAYVVVAIIIIGYAVSLWRRARRYRQGAEADQESRDTSL